MAVTSYRFAGTTANVDRSGKNPWSWTNYASADDTNYAYVTTAKFDYSDWLRLTNFGFTSSDIPDGATINGIEFVISRYASGSNVSDSSLKLYNNGAVGNELASATSWPTSIGEATYGGETNMCGTSLTQEDIVASTFGVSLSINSLTADLTAYVDYIKIRVYYTEGGGKPHYYYLQQ